MLNPEVHALTGAYACDALDPAERAAFEQHLAQCPTCAQEVAELRATAAMLGVAAAVEPPVRLKPAVDAAIGRTRQLAPATHHAATTSARRRRGFTFYLGWGAATAMACLVAVLGIRVASLQSRVDDANRQSTAISALLSAPDTRSGSGAVTGGGKAMVLVSRSRDEAAISLVGLTAAPPAKTYQLWMIGPAGIRSGGVLATDSHGVAQPVIAHNLGDAVTVGLTLEPAGGSAQPTTTPVLLLPMPT